MVTFAKYQSAAKIPLWIEWLVTSANAVQLLYLIGYVCCNVFDSWIEPGPNRQAPRMRIMQLISDNSSFSCAFILSSNERIRVDTWTCGYEPLRLSYRMTDYACIHKNRVGVSNNWIETVDIWRDHFQSSRYPGVQDNRFTTVGSLPSIINKRMALFVKKHADHKRYKLSVFPLHILLISMHPQALYLAVRLCFHVAYNEGIKADTGASAMLYIIIHTTSSQ